MGRQEGTERERGSEDDDPEDDVEGHAHRVTDAIGKIDNLSAGGTPARLVLPSTLPSSVRYLLDQPVLRTVRLDDEPQPRLAHHPPAPPPCRSGGPSAQSRCQLAERCRAS